MKDKILILEDNAAFAESLRNSLKDKSFDIDVASAGSVAIQKHQALTHQYAVVVLDYNLPDMTGVDVARRICRQNPNQEIIDRNEIKCAFKQQTHKLVKRKEKLFKKVLFKQFF